MPLYEGLVQGGSSVRELNSLPYCLLVCNWVVLLVVMECGRLPLLVTVWGYFWGEKFGEPFSRAETDLKQLFTF